MGLLFHSWITINICGWVVFNIWMCVCITFPWVTTGIYMHGMLIWYIRNKFSRIHLTHGMRYLSPGIHFVFHSLQYLPFGNKRVSFENASTNITSTYVLFKFWMTQDNATNWCIILVWFQMAQKMCVLMKNHLYSCNHIHLICSYMEYRPFNIFYNIAMAESRLGNWPIP